MKIMSYANMSTPKGIDALVIQDNTSDTTKHVLLQDLFKSVYPIGSVYINATNNSNPNSLLGFGTWEAIGAGRVMVGFDSGQTEFNATGKTGGAKTVSLTGDQNGTHAHGVYDPGHNHGERSGNRQEKPIHGSGDFVHGFMDGPTQGSTDWGYTGIGIYNSGSGSPHNNLQPYLTVHMWKRTA